MCRLAMCRLAILHHHFVSSYLAGLFKVLIFVLSPQKLKKVHGPKRLSHVC